MTRLETAELYENICSCLTMIRLNICFGYLVFYNYSPNFQPRLSFNSRRARSSSSFLNIFSLIRRSFKYVRANFSFSFPILLSSFSRFSTSFRALFSLSSSLSAQLSLASSPLPLSPFLSSACDPLLYRRHSLPCENFLQHGSGRLPPSSSSSRVATHTADIVVVAREELPLLLVKIQFCVN